MAIGSRVFAPEGWQTIAKEDYVYFLSRDDSSVLCVRYVELPGRLWRAALFSINVNDFESALKAGLLQADSRADQMPPWFPQSETREWAIRRWSSNEKSNLAAKERLVTVKKILEKVGREFGLTTYMKALNRAIRDAGLNTARVRTWILTFILFGESDWVLQPANWNLGKYERLDHGQSMLGRPSLLGRHYGKRLTAADIEIICRGYRRFRGEGKTQAWIYQQTLLHLYKVKSKEIVATEGGYKRIVRQDGAAIPSIYQFCYQLRKSFGVDQLYRDRFGREKERNKKKGHQGMYSEQCSNLMEYVERDAYVRKETLMGISGGDLGKLYVVHLVDRLSSAIVGVGFSLGAETKMAYRMAEFCSAIDKKKFLQIMGIEGIDAGDWPCVGLPAHTVTDRGPGSSENRGAVISELTPSYSPQSKPMVENSNPKKDHTSGAPSYERTSLSPMSLMRVVIREAVSANVTKDVSKRLSNEMVAKGTCITPVGVWNEMDSRLRNSAGMISFEEAVRRYLEPITVQVSREGIFKGHQRYHNLTLVERGLLDDAVSGVYELKAYYMPMNVRCIWVETDGGLLEVGAALPFADDEQQLYITNEEQAQLGSLLDCGRSALREHSTAIRVGMELDAKQENGIGMITSKKSSKRPKFRGTASRVERAAIQRNGCE